MPMATPITAEEPPGGPRAPAGGCVSGKASPAVGCVSGKASAVAGPTSAHADADPASARILREGTRDGCVTHVQHIPGQAGRTALWPDWVPAELRERFAQAGIEAPWDHQAAAAEQARAGRNVIVSTP